MCVVIASEYSLNQKKFSCCTRAEVELQFWFQRLLQTLKLRATPSFQTGIANKLVEAFRSKEDLNYIILKFCLFVNLKRLPFIAEINDETQKMNKL